MTPISVFDYAEQIGKALPRGILLNTCGEKFNSMVIGWGHLGFIWGLPTFTVYVRQSRYTKPQLDATGEFSLSVPAGDGLLSPEIMRVFGSQSGRDVNKADFVTLAPGRTIRTPAIVEYPLTLECRVLYRQDQAPETLPQALRDRYYGGGAEDFHTAYIAEIADAYIL
ncbi:MAG: flavin reductase [Clostridia bacterium]|nr:flavin reductase [Clostridia bacterium]